MIKYPFRNQQLSIDERTKDLLNRLTLDEKVHMLSMHQYPVERLNVGEWNIGTEIARGYVSRDGEISTVFPQPIGMASSFDKEMMNKIGHAAALETRAYFNKHPNCGLMMWGPTVDMERDPRWGRTEEAYGEDPFLTGEMTTEFTKGLKGDEKAWYTIPTLKHFCANNNECERFKSSSNLEPRMRYEYYYAAFKPAIVNGGAAAVMSAYNELSHIPAAMNTELKTLLKDKWGLCFVVTDMWDFAENVSQHKFTPSHAKALSLCLKAGVDCLSDNCDTVHNAAYEALKRGYIDESDIERAVFNVLKGRFSLGEFDEKRPLCDVGDEVINCDEHKALNREAALKGVTLLKNNGILPLKKDAESIAVVGPLANLNYRDWYSGESSYNITIAEGIKKEFSESSICVDNGYDIIAVKAYNGKYLSVKDNGDIYADADIIGENEMFELHDWGENWNNLYSVKYKKYLNVFDDNTVRLKSDMIYDFDATETLRITEIYGKTTFEEFLGHRRYVINENWKLSVQSPQSPNMENFFDVEILSNGISRVRELAKKCSYVMVCVGNDPIQTAKECHDRKNLELISNHTKLIECCFEENPNTILTLISSYPYAICNENDNLPAIIYTSHAGAELGTAVSKTVSGENNPAGRTPMTWYKSHYELPDIMEYDIANGKTTYMYYEGKSLYPFGYGLSYSEFKYSDMKIKDMCDHAEISVDVENVSDIDGDEVVQIYFYMLHSSVKRPKKKLCGFRRVSLNAHEKKTIILNVSYTELEIYDVSREKMCLETGEYSFMAGASSADIRLNTQLLVNGEVIPPRDLSVITRALNYDDKQYTELFYSKKYSDNYVYSQKTGYIVFKNVNFEDVTAIELAICSPIDSRNISVFINDREACIAKIPACDGFDDFKIIKIDFDDSYDGVNELKINMEGNIGIYNLKLL